MPMYLYGKLVLCLPLRNLTTYDALRTIQLIQAIMNGIYSILISRNS